MSAKCCIITTNVSGCPETIGEAGFTIDFEDSDKLRQILLKLSQDNKLLKKYQKISYKRLKEKFLLKNIIKEYEEVLIK